MYWRLDSLSLQHAIMPIAHEFRQQGSSNSQHNSSSSHQHTMQAGTIRTASDGVNLEIAKY